MDVAMDVAMDVDRFVLARFAAHSDEPNAAAHDCVGERRSVRERCSIREHR